VPGYSDSDWVCVGGDQTDADTVVVGLGDDVTCTITNDDIAPRLIVIKHVINDDGGTAVASAFTIFVTADDPSPASFAGEEVPGTVVTLDAGEYSVTEPLHPGYHVSFSEDCTGTIGIGETKTCIVTNDDFIISAVTDSSLCTFDVDASTPLTSEFRLNFTMDPQNPGKWLLNSTNPGQFYYNVFNYGAEGDPVTLEILVPFPFLTQGSNPIQVHSNFLILEEDGGICFEPQDDVTSAFTIETSALTPVSPSGAQIVTFEDYGLAPNLGSLATVTVTGEMPGTGQLYVTIHLDYGFKKTSGWMKDAGDDSADKDSDPLTPPNPEISIEDGQPYTFAVSGDVSDSQVVESINRFKRDPGFAGVVSLITPYGEEPLAGVRVQVYGPSNNLIGTVVTDADGVYLLVYKHTGKAAYYTVKLPDYGKQVKVLVKSNGWAIVNFTVP
jgi:hypothetical protein